MLSTPRRIHLTVMFSDLTDSTYLGSLLDPETYSDLLEKIRYDFEKIITYFGGQTIRIDGDGFIFIFANSGEGNGKLAVDAALKMHEKIQSYTLPGSIPANTLNLHTGIHAGRVLLKEGDLVLGKYEILGNATNVAAKICDSAKAGEILISEKALGRNNGLYRNLSLIHI